MLNIRRSYASFLSLVMTAARLSQHPGDFAVLEEEISSALTSLGAEMITSVLEAWDEKLAAERDRNEWELVQCKPRTIVSTVGEIRYRRRWY